MALGELGFNPLDNGRGQKGGDIAAEAGNLLDQTAGQVGVLLGTHDKDGLYPGYRAVGQGQGEFVMVVAEGADAAEDNVSLDLPDVFDREAFVAVHLHVGNPVHQLADHLQAFS